MSENKEIKTTPEKKRKVISISSKLLMYIVPLVVATVVVLVLVSASLSKSRMTEMATETLESSISNQADASMALQMNIAFNDLPIIYVNNEPDIGNLAKDKYIYVPFVPVDKSNVSQYR